MSEVCKQNTFEKYVTTLEYIFMLLFHISNESRIHRGSYRVDTGDSLRYRVQRNKLSTHIYSCTSWFQSQLSILMKNMLDSVFC
jgi:hypothetical protein